MTYSADWKFFVELRSYLCIDCIYLEMESIQDNNLLFSKCKRNEKKNVALTTTDVAQTMYKSIAFITLMSVSL